MRGFNYSPYFSSTERVENKEKVETKTDKDGFFQNIGKNIFKRGNFSKEGATGDSGDESKLDEESFGSKLKGQSGEIMALGVDTFNNFNTVAKTSKERQGNILKGAMQGGKIGMALGGPVPALIGAGLMAGINAIDAKADKIKEIDRKDKETREDFNETKDERAKVYDSSQKEKEHMKFARTQYGVS